jgi:hypothetical protein
VVTELGEPTGPVELLRPSSVSARGIDGTYLEGRPSVCLIEEDDDEGEHEGLMSRAAKSMDLSAVGVDNINSTYSIFLSHKCTT